MSNHVWQTLVALEEAARKEPAVRDLVLSSSAAEATVSANAALNSLKNIAIWRNLQSALQPPCAEASVAKSLLTAKPSPFVPPGAVASLAPKPVQWDEEGQTNHWPIDDSAVFYRSGSLSPSAEALGRRGFFDLNITMPLIIPGAEIRVIDSDGENYYNLATANPGAHLLFGRSAVASKRPGSTGGPESVTSDDPNFVVSVPADEATEPTSSGTHSGTAAGQTSGGGKPSAGGSGSGYPAVCDVWASFLNLQLGTIRNCRPDQIIGICQLFNKVFDQASPVNADEDITAAPYFLVPITIDCRGIYPRRSTSTKIVECYETRGTLLTENDRNRFRIIRRKLKKFVLLLWQEFGVQTDLPIRFDVALNDNCKSNNTEGLRIEIRRYSPLTHPDLLRQIWQTSDAGADTAAESKSPNADKSEKADRTEASTEPPTETLREHRIGADAASAVFELANLPPVSAQARVVVNEIRLELTHARMIDPRWPQQWVLARRMPATPATASSPPQLARHVFCSRIEMPKIVYEFASPKRALLDSRFAPLYHLAETASRDIDATEEVKRKARKDILSRQQQLNASAVPFYPHNPSSDSPLGEPDKLLNGSPSMDLDHQTAWDLLLQSASIANTDAQLMHSAQAQLLQTVGSDAMTFTSKLSPTGRASPLTSGGPFSTRALPLTEEVCRFYRFGTCARGEQCFFLHPADPQLESVADVRHLSPTNPIFF